MTKLFDQNAEIAILAIVLKNPNVVFDLTQVGWVMFSSTPNQNLFREIMALKDAGLIPEYTLLVEALKSKNRLAECGGAEYLEYLFQQDYDPTNLPAFVNIITKSFKGRSIFQISNKATEDLKSGNDADDVLGRMKDSLDGLSNFGGADGIQDFSEAVKETWEETKEVIQTKNYITNPTGINSIDAIMGGYRPGDMWVIAGRPSMGKSALLCNLVLSHAKQGKGVLVFSLEMNRQSIVQRMLAIETGIPITDIRFGTLDQKQVDILAEAVKRIKDLPIYIDTSFGISVDSAAQTIKKYNSNNGVSLAMIDYLQLMVERGDGATHELGRVTRRMKLLSNSLDITTILYSQLNRGVEERDDKRPILSDLRQSGNIEEDADIVAMLYRESVYNQGAKHKDQMEFIVRKHRNGPIGMMPLRFTSDTNKIGDWI